MTEEVTFVQVSATPYQFRDAVRFSNGREILLQKLQCGQPVDVLSVSSADFEQKEHRTVEEEYQRIFEAGPPGGRVAVALGRRSLWDCLSRLGPLKSLRP
jgi:hypothetical protein